MKFGYHRALKWLVEPSGDLAFWCKAAGMSMESVIERSRFRWQDKMAAIAWRREMSLGVTK